MRGESGRIAFAFAILMLPFAGIAVAVTMPLPVSRSDEATLGPVGEVSFSPIHLISPMHEGLSEVEAESSPWVALGSQMWDSSAEFRPAAPSHLSADDSGLLAVLPRSTRASSGFSLAQDYGLTILDEGPSHLLITRASDIASFPSLLTDLNSDPRVIWSGGIRPADRLHPDLWFTSTTQEVQIVLAKDRFSDTLERIGPFLSLQHCSTSTCLLNPVSPNTIHALAHDPGVLWVAPVLQIVPHNSEVALAMGVRPASPQLPSGLTGLGQMISIADGGVDDDHPDLDDRILSVSNVYAPDISSLDSFTGHGTHMAGMIAGTGDSNSTLLGLAPSSYIWFYQVGDDAKQGELDPSWNSLVDLYTDARNRGARIHLNAWGAKSNHGNYTTESSDTDSAIRNNRDLLVIYSAGNDASNGITSPATAKNSLAIGVSTTAEGGSVQDDVWASSSRGPTADGRIKPDLVAPGTSVCSSRAEELASPAAPSCTGGSTHTSGSSHGGVLTGSSMSAAAVAGASALIRQYLVDNQSISAPSGDLMRAMLVQGATDIGAPDVPNSAEGWGRADLLGSLAPSDGMGPLETWVDDQSTLLEGRSLAYGWQVTGGSDFEVSLAWSDLASSSLGAQNASHLIDDLDLVVRSPSGLVYLGNVFSSGQSSTSGSADRLNTIERIYIPSAESGIWTVRVLSAAGGDVEYALVTSTRGSVDSRPDFSIREGGVVLYPAQPQRGERTTIQVVWANEGYGPAGNHLVKIEDVTESILIDEHIESSLASGKIGTLSITHKFTTVGQHTLRISLDPNDAVPEPEDAISGAGPNVFLFDFLVSDVGLRLDVEDPETDALAIDAADEFRLLNRPLDPMNHSKISWEIHLSNEGTSPETGLIEISQVQRMRESDGMLFPASSGWSASIVGGLTKIELSEESGSTPSKEFEVILEDTLADLNADPPIRARAGTYVVDVTITSQNDSKVSDNLRFVSQVEVIESIRVSYPGGTDIAAAPRANTDLRMSLENEGNAPVDLRVTCMTPRGWVVDHVASTPDDVEVVRDLASISPNGFLPLIGAVYVPAVSAGLPAAGDIEKVDCTVKSRTTGILLASPSYNLTVLPLTSFTSVLRTSGNSDILPGGWGDGLDPINLVEGVSQVFTMEIFNDGNQRVDLSVSCSIDRLTWGFYVDESTSTGNGILVNSSENGTFDLILDPGPDARGGDEAELSISLKLDGVEMAGFVIEVRLLPRASLSLVPDDPDEIEVGSGGRIDTHWTLTNTGNVLVDQLVITPHVSGVDSAANWSIGFANLPPSSIEPGATIGFSITLKAPDNLAGGTSGILGIEIDSLLTESIFDSISLKTIGASILSLSLDRDQFPDVDPEIGIDVKLSVSNIGSEPATVRLVSNASSAIMVQFEQETFDLAAGDRVDLMVSVIPSPNLKITSVLFDAWDTSGNDWSINGSTSMSLSSVSATSAELTFSERVASPTGIGIVAVILAIVSGLLFFIFRSPDLDEGEELVDFSVPLNQDFRRREALSVPNQIGMAGNEGVSDSEIASILAASNAPPPLPSGALGGLPPLSPPQTGSLPPAPSPHSPPAAGLPPPPAGLPPPPAGLPPPPGTPPFPPREG